MFVREGLLTYYSTFFYGLGPKIYLDILSVYGTFMCLFLIQQGYFISWILWGFFLLKWCKLLFNKIICVQTTVNTYVSQVENITVSPPVEADIWKFMDVNAYQRITAATDTAVHLQM